MTYHNGAKITYVLVATGLLALLILYRFSRASSSISVAEENRTIGATTKSGPVRIDEQIDVQEISSPAELSRRYYWYESQRGRSVATDTEVGDDHVKTSEQMMDRQTDILFRLGDIQTDEAARVLVNIMKDSRLMIDGEMGLNVSHNISRCGKNSLKYLEAIDNPAPKVAVLIEHIRDGRLYGP